MIPDLKDRVVLVTGAASGIGRATALAFARRGAHLVVTDINAAALDAVKQEVSALDARCYARTADVSDEAAMRSFAEMVQATVGPLHVLINNAGIGYLGGFVSSPLEAWRRCLDSNVLGVVHGCYFFLPAMIAAGGPRRVVNVAALAGIAPAATMSAYAASKSAVMGLTDVLALELASTEVGVTAVCPGIIDTAITASPSAISPSVPAEQLARLRTYYKANGASPDVVAEAIVDGVVRGKSLVLVGPMARPAYHVKRVSRTLLRRLSLTDSRKAGYL
jgi:NAD(P)-dependent dehydrogenase (short-subunit alcohol dehydrogenase family)